METHETSEPNRDRESSSEPLHGRYETLHLQELGAILERRPIAFVPSGTLEWHSHHLPLGLDGLIAEEVCLRSARKVGGVVVPTTYWAIGGVPHAFTMRIEPTVIEALFVSILEQLGQVGFTTAIVFAGHYGLDHHSALKRAALRVMERSGLIVHALPVFELVTDLGFRSGDHAGAWETSLLWALQPALVRMERLPSVGALEGIQGEDPRQGASEEYGHAQIESMVERLAQLAKRLLHSSYEERSAHKEALAAQVAYLGDIQRERALKPLVHARPLLSDTYLRALDALWRGQYQTVMEALDRARLDVLLANEGGST